MKKLVVLTMSYVRVSGASGPKVYNNGTFEGICVGKKGDVVVAVTF